MTPIARFAALVAWLLLSTFGADARPRSDFRHAKNQLAKEGVFTERCGSSAPGRSFCRWFRIDSRRVVGRSAEGVLIATRMTHWMSENPLDDFRRIRRTDASTFEQYFFCSRRLSAVIFRNAPGKWKVIRISRDRLTPAVSTQVSSEYARACHNADLEQLASQKGSARAFAGDPALHDERELREPTDILRLSGVSTPGVARRP